jgi:uncharacterized protein YgbK (DUF1537 family)
VRDAAGAGVAWRGTVLVVVGSLHPVATAQLHALRAAGLDGVELLASRRVVGAVTDERAEAVAVELAAAARHRLADVDVDVLVIVGGDTAAAVLGDVPFVAGGTVAPGIPWARRADGTGPLVVTKAGGFGDPDTLVRLLRDRHVSEGR